MLKIKEIIFMFHSEKKETMSLTDLCDIFVGAGSNDSYTFHMHGYGMQVVATGQSANGTELSKEKFQLLDKEGKIQR